MSLPGDHVARERLREVAAELAALDSKRAELAGLRDSALVDARAAGASWVELQGDSGMTVGGVAKAFKRVVK